MAIRVKPQYTVPISLLAGVVVSLSLNWLHSLLSADPKPSDLKSAAVSIVGILLMPNLGLLGVDFWLLPNMLIYSVLAYLALFGWPI
jgi:hypothetical protein